MDHRTIRRGDIFYADLPNREGSEQSGMRPVIVIQNDKGNLYSQTVIVACITSRIKKLYMPTHVLLYPGCTGLKKVSMVMLEQITTVDKMQLLDYVGHSSKYDLYKINRAICESTGIRTNT